jgi:hypothetical protein
MNEITGYTTSWVDTVPTSEQEWIDKLEKLKLIERRAGWEFAKWLVWGVHQYSRTVDDIAAQVDYKPKTLRNIIGAMKNRATTIAIDLGLSVSHAMEVLGLPDEEKQSILTEAAEKLLTPSDVRYMVHLLRKPVGGNAIGSAPLNDNHSNDETYQTNGEGPTAPVLSSDIDPSAGVVVWGMDEPDDVPFTHVPLSIDIPAPVKAFEVAEYIVNKWGKAFATEVAGEMSRWW